MAQIKEALAQLEPARLGELLSQFNQIAVPDQLPASLAQANSFEQMQAAANADPDHAADINAMISAARFVNQFFNTLLHTPENTPLPINQIADVFRQVGLALNAEPNALGDDAERNLTAAANGLRIAHAVNISMPQPAEIDPAVLQDIGVAANVNIAAPRVLDIGALNRAHFGRTNQENELFFKSFAEQLIRDPLSAQIRSTINSIIMLQGNPAALNYDGLLRFSDSAANALNVINQTMQNLPYDSARFILLDKTRQMISLYSNTALQAMHGIDLHNHYQSLREENQFSSIFDDALQNTNEQNGVDHFADLTRTGTNTYRLLLDALSRDAQDERGPEQRLADLQQELEAAKRAAANLHFPQLANLHNPKDINKLLQTAQQRYEQALAQANERFNPLPFRQNAAQNAIIKMCSEMGMRKNDQSLFAQVINAQMFLNGGNGNIQRTMKLLKENENFQPRITDAQQPLVEAAQKLWTAYRDSLPEVAPLRRYLDDLKLVQQVAISELRLQAFNQTQPQQQRPQNPQALNNLRSELRMLAADLQKMRKTGINTTPFTNFQSALVAAGNGNIDMNALTTAATNYISEKTRNGKKPNSPVGSGRLRIAHDTRVLLQRFALSRDLNTQFERLASNNIRPRYEPTALDVLKENPFSIRNGWGQVQLEEPEEEVDNPFEEELDELAEEIQLEDHFNNENQPNNPQGDQANHQQGVPVANANNAEQMNNQPNVGEGNNPEQGEPNAIINNENQNNQQEVQQGNPQNNPQINLGEIPQIDPDDIINPYASTNSNNLNDQNERNPLNIPNDLQGEQPNLNNNAVNNHLSASAPISKQENNPDLEVAPNLSASQGRQPNVNIPENNGNNNLDVPNENHENNPEQGEPNAIINNENQLNNQQGDQPNDQQVEPQRNHLSASVPTIDNRRVVTNLYASQGRQPNVIQPVDQQNNQVNASVQQGNPQIVNNLGNNVNNANDFNPPINNDLNNLDPFGDLPNRDYLDIVNPFEMPNPAQNVQMNVNDLGNNVVNNPNVSANNGQPQQNNLDNSNPFGDGSGGNPFEPQDESMGVRGSVRSENNNSFQQNDPNNSNQFGDGSGGNPFEPQEESMGVRGSVRSENYDPFQQNDPNNSNLYVDGNEDDPFASWNRQMHSNLGNSNQFGDGSGGNSFEPHEESMGVHGSVRSEYNDPFQQNVQNNQNPNFSVVDINAAPQNNQQNLNDNFVDINAFDVVQQPVANTAPMMDFPELSNHLQNQQTEEISMEEFFRRWDEYNARNFPATFNDPIQNSWFDINAIDANTLHNYNVGNAMNFPNLPNNSEVLGYDAETTNQFPDLPDESQVLGNNADQFRDLPDESQVLGYDAETTNQFPDLPTEKPEKVAAFDNNAVADYPAAPQSKNPTFTLTHEATISIDSSSPVKPSFSFTPVHEASISFNAPSFDKLETLTLSQRNQLQARQAEQELQKLAQQSVPLTALQQHTARQHMETIAVACALSATLCRMDREPAVKNLIETDQATFDKLCNNLYHDKNLMSLLPKTSDINLNNVGKIDREFINYALNQKVANAQKAPAINNPVLQKDALSKF